MSVFVLCGLIAAKARKQSQIIIYCTAEFQVVVENVRRLAPPDLEQLKPKPNRLRAILGVRYHTDRERIHRAYIFRDQTEPGPCRSIPLIPDQKHGLDKQKSFP